MKNTFIDSTGKVQLKLTGNVTATQLDWTCSYYDKNLTGNAITEWEYSGVSNNTTAVDICLAPASGHTRTIKNITVYNADSATQTVILQLVDGWGTRVLIRNSLISLASRSADDMSFYTDISGKANIDSPVFTTKIQTPTIELWAASDTTLARVSAGVMSVEWVTVDTISATNTLTNKRITPRIISTASYTTDTGTSLNADNCDMFIVTAQTGALKFNNPWGTPTDWQKLLISVASSTTSARALTWDTLYWATTVALPTTTTATVATLTIGFIYSTSKSLWQCVWVA